MTNTAKAVEMIDKLMRVSRLLHLHRLETMRAGSGMDVTRGRGRVLAVLNAVGEISPGDLAFILQIRQQSMNETLKKLEDAGLIDRRQDESDKRRMIIGLTEKGKAEVPQVPEELGRIFDCLSEEEKTQLGEYLDRIADALSAEMELPEKLEQRMQAMRERMGDERFRMMMFMRAGLGRTATPLCTPEEGNI